MVSILSLLMVKFFNASILYQPLKTLLNKRRYHTYIVEELYLRLFVV